MSYDASAIQVLEGLDAVRKRPGMYIGSTGERGLHHLVYEIVDNSVDEALAGFATEIVVSILDDSKICVIDNGRGIPVDLHKTEKKPALEVVFTVLHAGGKFGGGGYQVSGGLHGVGASVVNALSSELHVEVKRDGFLWTQSYKKGVPTAALKKGKAVDGSGTKVTFKADKEVFETTEYSFDSLATRFREMAFLNKGLSLTLIDERKDRLDEKGEKRIVNYKYEGGIIDFVNFLNKAKGETLVHKDVIHIENEDKKKSLSAEVALQWNFGYQEAVYTFANTINTHEGGMHEEGFRAALTATVNKYAKQWGVLKEKDPKLTGEDIREGLTAIVSVKLREPQFEGQTKTKLGNTEAKTFVQTMTNDLLAKWFEEHPSEGKDVARKAVSAATARMAA
ncbi:MAG: ATP-binding protein, partial [Actinomycetes bacterium]